MLPALTLLMMLLVGYAFLQEGLLAAFSTLCSVVLAGLVAFGWFEPIAAELESWVAGTFLHGFEDCVALIGLFSLVVALLRHLVGRLADEDPSYPPVARQVGAGLCGLVTGYLLAGFLLCVFQTLPWQRDFLGFDHRVRPNDPEHKLRRVLPPDRVWLAMVGRASRHSLGPGSASFDPDGTFELRYHRLRRSP